MQIGPRTVSFAATQSQQKLQPRCYSTSLTLGTDTKLPRKHETPVSLLLKPGRDQVQHANLLIAV